MHRPYSYAYRAFGDELGIENRFLEERVLAAGGPGVVKGSCGWERCSGSETVHCVLG